MEKERKLYTFDRVVRGVIGIIVVVALFIVINRLRSVLLPFVIGMLIAYLLNPMVCFIQNKMRIKFRVLSIFLSFVFIGVLVWSFIAIIIPAISIEGARLSRLMGLMTQRWASEPILPEAWQGWITQQLEAIDYQAVFSGEAFRETLNKVMPHFWSVISGTWSFVTGFFMIFIVLMYIFFILMDYKTVTRGIIGAIPQKYQGAIVGLITDLQHGMNHYFRGQGLVAFIVGILFAIGFKIIGLPMAITLGLIIGVLNLVPYMQTFGLIPVVFFAYLQSFESVHGFGWHLIGPLVVFVIVQSLQDLLLVPTIMKKQMGLNPAIILLSLSVWGSLLGVLGMIIALPITTLLISYYKRYVINKEKFIESID